MREKISIIGAGNWASVLAIILAKQNAEVCLHSVFPAHNLQMQEEQENKSFLKGVKFPYHLSIEPSLEEALKSTVIVTAIPVKFLRGILRRMKQTPVSCRRKTIVSVSKGIEAGSLLRPSEIISQELNASRIAVLSGPNIAHEVIAGIPTTSVIACRNILLARKLQKIFTTPHFRIYVHRDIVGVELGGALKNIIAIACGISDGLGFGTNTKAALVTRGMVEIGRLGKRLGARPITFTGISGFGDLVTTCFSPFSRNRFVGEEIGKGKKIKAILEKMSMVAEGVDTVRAAYLLSKKMKVEMPITREVYLTLYRNKPPQKAVKDLMTRPLKAETLA